MALFAKIVPRFGLLKRTKITMGHPIDHATGIEKRELLARLAGDDDPFNHRLLKRGPGTKEHPVEIPSAFESRVVGCYCAEWSVSLIVFEVYKGQPRRCECGYWFCLVHKPAV